MKKILFILLLIPVVAKSQYTDTTYKNDHIEYYFIWNTEYLGKKSKQEGIYKVYKDKIVSQCYDNKKPIFTKPDTLVLDLDKILLENDTLKYKTKNGVINFHANRKYEQQNSQWTYLYSWLIESSKTKFPDYYNKYFVKKR